MLMNCNKYLLLYYTPSLPLPSPRYVMLSEHEEIKIVLDIIVNSIENNEKKMRQVSKEKAWEKAIDNFNYEEFKNMHK